MPRTTLWDLTDRIVPGGLDAWLRERRQAGDSLADIARTLHDDHEITVSTELIRTWVTASANR